MLRHPQTDGASRRVETDSDSENDEPAAAWIAAQRRREQFGTRRPRPSGVKRRAADAMTCLDDLASSNDLSSNAYNTLAKALKSVHDASEARAARLKRAAAVEIAVESPWTMMSFPSTIDWVEHSFLYELLRKKRKEEARHVEKQKDDAAKVAARHANSIGFEKWAKEVVEQFAGPADTSFDPEWRCSGIMVLLETAADTFAEPLLNYLQGDLSFVCPFSVFEDADLMMRVADRAPCLDEWVWKGCTDESGCCSPLASRCASPSLTLFPCS